MTHNIDTKAIQELAAMSPEAKAYLEREFPGVFISKATHCNSIAPAFAIPTHNKHDVISGDWMISTENNMLSQFIRYTDDDCFLAQTIIGDKWKVVRLLGYQFRPATIEEIQRFIPDYKPNV